jgi:hypothetical protein
LTIRIEAMMSHGGLNTTVFRSDGLALTILGRREPGAEAEEGVPSFLEFSGIVDTDAPDFCLDYRAAHALKLREIDQMTIQVDGGVTQASRFLADIEIPAIGFRKLVPVVASSVGRLSYHALIGRSTMSDFHVTFHGPAECFSFVPASEAGSPPADEAG